MESVKIQISPNLLTPSVTEEFEGVIPELSLKFDGNDFTSVEPLNWQVSVVNGGEDYLYIEGSVSGMLKTRCVRCLEDALFDFDSTIEGYAKYKDTAKLPDDVIDDECVMVKNNTIEIYDFIVGAVALDLPLHPLCSDDCKGLFEYCDSNDESEEGMQNPFDVLKNYEF